MHRFVTMLCVIFVLIATLSNSVTGRPTEKLVRHKRQSDQRLAELETLLALQKYRHHRLRPEHKGSQPGYGVIDFNTIGRRKKSTRFSPGERNFRTVARDPAFTRAAKNLGEDTDQQMSLADGSLNEKIDSLVSYQTLVIRDPTPQKAMKLGMDIFEEDKK